MSFAEFHFAIGKRPDLTLVEQNEDAQTAIASPDILHYVEDYDIGAPKSKNGITTSRLRAVLDNKSQYTADITSAHEPQVQYSRLVAKSFAWHTDGEDFFNKDMTNGLAKAGMTVVDFSHENILHSNLADSLSRFWASSVHNDAHAQHAILDLIDDEKLLPNDTSEIIATGMSKGCIVGRLAVNYAGAYGREVSYFDGVDPSGEHPWSLRDINIDRLKKIAYGPIVEAIGFLSIASEAPAAELLETAAHYATSPGLITSHLAATRTLVRGDAGKDFAASEQTNGIMHFTCFEGCWFNQHESWITRLGRLPNTHVEKMPGGHIKGASRPVRNVTIARITNVQELLEAGYTPEDINPATQTLRQLPFTNAA
jgi:hypothetical protein